MANLTGSWLAFRLGVDPVRIERMRREGELYAVRNDSGEWESRAGSSTLRAS